eukprot:SM000176S03127  [mRNA]  locus=s176:89841:95315:+ [translate_table: standard]
MLQLTTLPPSCGRPEADGVPPPPPAPGLLPDVARADLAPYLEAIAEPYGRFVDVRQHDGWERAGGHGSGAVMETAAVTETAAAVEEGSAGGHGGGDEGGGGGLAACTRQIPPLFFAEDFALESGATFAAACQVAGAPAAPSASLMLQEKLSHYLDLVEVHLVREISARSSSFFDALAQLEGLHATVAATCGRVAGLRGTVGALHADLAGSAAAVQALGQRRADLLELEAKLRLVSYVRHAAATLQLLVASADCTAALDVIDDLRRLLYSDDLVGFHCFRHLGDQLASAAQSVNGMLMADFVREAIHESADLEPSAILASFAAHDKLPAIAALEVAADDGLMAPEVGGGGSGSSGGEDEATARLREQLLPIAIGLLRTSKLPAVLRMYKETLMTDIKVAIKCVVAEVLPVLVASTPAVAAAADDEQLATADSVGPTLAVKLRGLPADGFVRLLGAVSNVVQRRLARAAAVRAVTEQIVGGLPGSYAAAAVAAALASGVAQAQREEAGDRGAADGGLALSSKQFRADVVREGAEALWAGCDAAHGRWAKLLGVRAAIHARLALGEFVAVYGVTQDFIASTERVGGRLGYAIRGTLQSQAKAFVDAQHAGRMGALQAALERETWVAVNAPDELRDIFNSFLSSEADDGDSTNEHGQAPVPQVAATANGLPPVFPPARVSEVTVNGVEPVFRSDRQAVDNSLSVADTAERRRSASNLSADGENGSSKADEARPSGGSEQMNIGKVAADTEPVSHAVVIDAGSNRGELGSAQPEVGLKLDLRSGPPPNDSSSNGGGGVGGGGSPEGSGAQALPVDLDNASGATSAAVNGDASADSQQALNEPEPAAAVQVQSGLSEKEVSQKVPPLESTKTAELQRSSVQLGSGDLAGVPAVVDGQAAKARKLRDKPSVKTLPLKGNNYHVVDSVLLATLLQENLHTAEALPAMAMEVVHRVAELLKLFNSRTCQLVLGAGAMQVSGLKSITAKHLALASQSISLYYAIIPDIRRLLALHIPEARQGLLLTEIDHVCQDYRVHRDEIHSKLVAIMKERLVVHLRTLPGTAEAWAKDAAATENRPGDEQASQFARALTKARPNDGLVWFLISTIMATQAGRHKEVGVLHRVLSPILLDGDVCSIFTRVVALFHSQLSDAFSRLDLANPQIRRRVLQDVQLILLGLSALPVDAPPGKARQLDLDSFLATHYSGGDGTVASMSPS